MEILNNERTQVVWFTTERKTKKKDLGKQFPVTYILSSQFRVTVINLQPALPQHGLPLQSHLLREWLDPTHKSKFIVKNPS